MYQTLSISLSDSRVKSCAVWLSLCLHLEHQEVLDWASYHQPPPSVSVSGSLALLQAGDCFSSTVDWLHSVRYMHNKNENTIFNLGTLTQSLSLLFYLPAF